MAANPKGGKREWVVLFLIIVGGVVGYKVLKSVGMMLGIWHVAAPPAKATSPNFGPYPLRVESMQDNEAYWYDPAKAIKQAHEANQAHVRRAQSALKEADGHVEKALSQLMGTMADPDSAQALMRAMRELAPQGSEVEALAKTKTPDNKPARASQPKPLFQTSEGTPGIVQVAKVAERLAQRKGSPEETRFDGVILEDAIRLLGHYGAAQVPEGKHVAQADGTGQIAPIDPIVRGVLRSFLHSEGLTQTLASRALGQLGDMETAKDLIENPSRYKAASISDFGPKAVELYKAQALKRMKEGKGQTEAEFLQSMRLTYRDRDAAYELARAGDGGAALAFERSAAIEAAYARESDDSRYARNLDIWLRFPGTPQGMRGLAMLDQLWMELADQPLPKTRQMILRCLDRDWDIVFRKKTWREGVGHELSPFVCALPMDLYYGRRGWEKEGLLIRFKFDLPKVNQEAFYQQVEALFRKHYASRVECNADGTTDGLSLFARCIGLPRIDYPEWKYVRAELRGDDNFGPKELIKAGILDGSGRDY